MRDGDAGARGRGGGSLPAMRRFGVPICAALLALAGAGPARAAAGHPSQALGVSHAVGHRAVSHVVRHRGARRGAARKNRGCRKPPTAVEALAVKVAEDGWKAKSAHDRAVGLSILARIHGRCEAKKVAIGLASSSPELKTAAAVAAAETGVHRAAARKAAKALLTARSPWLRVQAAEALLDLGDPMGRKALVGLAEGAPKVHKGAPTVGFAVATYAAMRLAVEAHRAGQGALMALAGGNQTVDLIARAGLVRLGDRGQLARIRAAARAGVPIALHLLGDVGGPGDEKLLEQRLGGTPQVHRAAVEALAALGHTGPLARGMRGVDLTEPGHESLVLLAIASRARAKAMLPRFVGLMTHGILDMRLYAAQLVLRADYPDVP